MPIQRGKIKIAAMDGDLIATLSGERYRLNPPRKHEDHSGPVVGDWLTVLNNSDLTTVDAVILVTIDRGADASLPSGI